MKYTKQFIGDAIEGGYSPKPQYYWATKKDIKANGVEFHGDDRDREFYTIYQLLLSPKAWQAVGKTRGWKGDVKNSSVMEVSHWRFYMHFFIDHLADGKSIEEALEAISK